MVRYIDIKDGVRPSPNHHDHFAPAPASFRPGFGIPALGGDLSRFMSPPPSECTMEAGSGGISTTKKNIVLAKSLYISLAVRQSPSIE